MSSLADLPDLVGFFSYSRSDDGSDGALSLLRERIRIELRKQLGRGLRLWQDTKAIPFGALWEAEITRAIAESAFFIPIVSPSAFNSRYCRMEYEAFLAREAELHRDDLVFPMLYIPVPGIGKANQPAHEVLKIIHARQYADWTEIRHDDVDSAPMKKEIAYFCKGIVAALRRNHESPRGHSSEETGAPRLADEERQRTEDEHRPILGKLGLRETDVMTPEEPIVITDDQVHALGAIVRYHLFKNFDTQESLAKRCGLSPLERTRDGETSLEYARIFTGLCNEGSKLHAEQIARTFRSKIITASYANRLPPYIRQAIYEAFPKDARAGLPKDEIELTDARTTPRYFVDRFANYDPSRIDAVTTLMTGLWHAVRYSHQGNRVVRAPLEICRPDEKRTMHPFPTFIIHFRTRDMTGKPNTKPFTTTGCLVPLQERDEMVFLGVEDTGYPVTILSRIPRPPRGVELQYFDGVVQRRHHRDNVLFAMPVDFIRAPYAPILQYPSEKTGSWPEDDAIARITPDIPHIEHLLKRLRRPRRKLGRGAIIAGDYEWPSDGRQDPEDTPSTQTIAGTVDRSTAKKKPK